MNRDVSEERQCVGVQVRIDRLLNAEGCLLAGTARFESGHDLAHRLVAVLDLLGDHLLEDGLNFFGHFGSQRRNRLFPMGQELRHQRLAVVGGFAGEQVVAACSPGYKCRPVASACLVLRACSGAM